MVYFILILRERMSKCTKDTTEYEWDSTIVGLINECPFYYNVFINLPSEGVIIDQRIIPVKLYPYELLYSTYQLYIYLLRVPIFQNNQSTQALNWIVLPRVNELIMKNSRQCAILHGFTMFTYLLKIQLLNYWYLHT